MPCRLVIMREYTKFHLNRTSGSMFFRPLLFAILQTNSRHRDDDGDALGHLGTKTGDRFVRERNKIQPSPTPGLEDKRLNCGLGYVKKFGEPMMT